MKKIKLLFIILFTGMALQLSAQINVLNSTDGSLTITPKGIKGKLPIGAIYDSTNIAIGENALKSVTSATKNIAIGKNALSSYSFNGVPSTSAANNIAIGYESQMFSKATTTSFEAFNNVSLGNLSLRNNTTGGNNVSIGFRTLSQNTTGDANTAVGNMTLNVNTIGDFNTAIGAYALYGNKIGKFNVAVGADALYLNREVEVGLLL